MTGATLAPGSRVGFALAVLGIRFVGAGLILFGVDLSQDEEFYDEIARNLLDGRGFTSDPAAGPNLWRGPVYPLLLAGLLVWPLPLSMTVPVAQTLLDAGTCWFTYRLFRDVGHRAALLAGMLTWVNPLLIYYSLRFLAESLFTFLLTATLLLMHRAVATRGLVVAGILCGAAILCRGSLVGFPPLAMLWLAHRARGWRRLQAPAVFAVAVLAVLSPWLWRNYTVSGILTPGTGGAYAMWLGNHQPTQGLDTDQLDPPRAKMLEETIHRLTGGRPPLGTEVERAFAEAAWAEIRSSPLGFVSLLGRKFGRLWFEVYSPARQWLQALLIPVQTVFLTACVAGIYVGWSTRRAPFGLLLLVSGYFVVLHTFTVATVRYMVPLLPLLSGFAALALDHAVRWLQSVLRRPGALPN